MKLIELSANKESFKTVVFNESGLSLIIATKEDPDSKSTFNSVGKSLIIALIHFCLGSNKNDQFKDKLKGWEFTLKFKIGEKIFSSIRSTQDQSIIYLNGQKKTVTLFNDIIFEYLFNNTESTKFLSFRSLISRFIRQSKEGYNNFDTFIPKENNITQLVNNSWLLGLDVNRVLKKYNLKQEHDKIENLRKNIESNQEFLSLIGNNKKTKDIDIHIQNTKDLISNLSNDIENFTIAENYSQMKIEADNISKQLQDFRNKLTITNQNIESIEKSLKINPDITFSEINSLYEQVNIKFPEAIKKQIEEVEQFHNSIIYERKIRLKNEKEKIIKRRTTILEQIKIHGDLEDSILQKLKGKGALEEYSALNQKLTEIKSKYDRLEFIKQMTTQFKNRLSNINIELEQDNISTNNYLDQDFSIIKEENTKIFSNTAQEFYSHKLAGIEISNNEGNNQIRFNVNASINTDAGDAVGNIKIFCYDWMVLQTKRNHNIEFIFHDSRITADVDPRQIATLLKFALNKSIESNTQYILSVNENILNDAISNLSEEERKNILDSVILELSDLDNSKKLLGEYVEMNY